MSEAEDVVDAARHATVFTRDLWLRNRRAPNRAPEVGLFDVAARLDLLITAVLGFGVTKLEFATGQDSYLNKDDVVYDDSVAYQESLAALGDAARDIRIVPGVE